MQSWGDELLQCETRISKIGQAEETKGTRRRENFPGLTQQRPLKLSL